MRPRGDTHQFWHLCEAERRGLAVDPELELPWSGVTIAARSFAAAARRLDHHYIAARYPNAFPKAKP